MELQTLQTADYLDIIFDKRNKTYGGYELRRHYNRRLGKAFGLLMLAMSGFICLSFVSRTKTPADNIAIVRPTVFTDIHTPVLPQPVVVPPSPPVAQRPPAKTHIFTPPVITDDQIPDDRHMSENKALTHAAAGLSNSGSDSLSIDVVPSRPPSRETGVVVNLAKEGPRHIVEQMPLFTGDLSAYIGSHLHYPAAAREQGIEGRVIIEFIVNEDGSVSGARVVRSIGGGCDEEALRMVAGMPAWKPGKQNGIPVKVYFTLPVKFELH